MQTSPSVNAPPLAERRQPPIAFAFGLFSGLLAILFMRALGTAELDAGAYEVGVLLAAGAGAFTAWLVRVLRPYPRYRRLAVPLVIAVGALVGVAIQAVLLVRSPVYRAYVLSTGISTADPLLWLLVGVPLGALPALVAAAFLTGAERRFAGRAYDARERLFFPFATGAALLAAAALGAVGGRERALVGGVMALAIVALGEIALADRARARWLRRIFDGHDPTYGVVPLEDEREAHGLPLVVGGVVPLSVIVENGEDRGYRAAARIPLAATGMSVVEALAPLRRRGALVLVVVLLTLARGAAMVCGAF